MHIQVLASFIFICTYSALVPLVEGKSIVKRDSDATTSKPASNTDTTIIPTDIDETTLDGSNKDINEPAEVPPAKDIAENSDNKPQSTDEDGNSHPHIDQGNGQSKNVVSKIQPKNNGPATDDKASTTVPPIQQKPNTKHAGSGFHGLSFFVGILFSVGVMIVSYGCYRHYKKRTSTNTSLLSREDYATF